MRSGLILLAAVLASAAAAPLCLNTADPIDIQNSWCGSLMNCKESQINLSFNIVQYRDVQLNGQFESESELKAVPGMTSSSLSALLQVSTYLCRPRNVTDIIADNGYEWAAYHVTTPDGFVLGVQRIPPYGKMAAIGDAKGVAFLQHGLTDSAAGWTLNGKGKSLAFILADAGVDVWLGNNRGGPYSMKNIHYSPKDAEFWAWSWDEYAKYDLPSQVDLVRQQTGADRIAYIGHSQGTTQAFAALSAYPTVADKLTTFVALAPVAWVGHVGSKLLQALAHLELDKLFQLLGIHEFYEPAPSLLKKIVPDVCRETPQLCDNIVELICGKSRDVNATMLPFYAKFEPNPTSVQDIAHYAQMIRDDEFTFYDYGSASKNKAHYGTATPPAYHPQNISSTLPMYLYYGAYDDLGDPTDVLRLQPLLPSTTVFKEYPNYAHLDFLLGESAPQILYPLVVEAVLKHAE